MHIVAKWHTNQCKSSTTSVSRTVVSNCLTKRRLSKNFCAVSLSNECVAEVQFTMPDAWNTARACKSKVFEMELGKRVFTKVVAVSAVHLCEIWMRA